MFYFRSLKLIANQQEQQGILLFEQKQQQTTMSRSFTTRNSRKLLLSILGLVAVMVVKHTVAFQSAVVPTNTNCGRPKTHRSMVDSSSFMDGVQGFMKKFTTKATASHILIKGGAEAANKLDDIKLDLMGKTNTDDDEDDTTYSASTLLSKFSQAASKYSDCPSASKGGSLGSFRPGQMVKEFDTVVFNEPIGTIHGPIQTQFGYHLIYIQSRSD